MTRRTAYMRMLFDEDQPQDQPVLHARQQEIQRCEAGAADTMTCASVNQLATAESVSGRETVGSSPRATIVVV